MFDLRCPLQSCTQLNHAGRATRSYNFGAALLDGPPLTLDNALRRLEILHEIGSGSTRAAIGIRHLHILDARQASQNRTRLFGDSRSSQVTRGMVGHLALPELLTGHGRFYRRL